MKLEDQICTVIQSEQFKKIGISQVSLFYHTWLGIPLSKSNCDLTKGTKLLASAFTASELGAMLQQYTRVIFYDEEDKKWMRKDFDKEVKEDTREWVAHDTQAQAYADYLIFRINKGWFTIEELNKRLLSE